METDRLGKGQHEPGAKLDAGKPRVSLVLLGFQDALIEVAKVGTMGANKYTDNGWLSVPQGRERYSDALLRHFLTPEEWDKESKLLHAAHTAWNALAVLQLQLNEMKEYEYENKPEKERSRYPADGNPF